MPAFSVVGGDIEQNHLATADRRRWAGTSPYAQVRRAISYASATARWVAIGCVRRHPTSLSASGASTGRPRRPARRSPYRGLLRPLRMATAIRAVGIKDARIGRSQFFVNSVRCMQRCGAEEEYKQEWSQGVPLSKGTRGCAESCRRCPRVWARREQRTGMHRDEGDSDQVADVAAGVEADTCADRAEDPGDVHASRVVLVDVEGMSWPTIWPGSSADPFGGPRPSSSSQAVATRSASCCGKRVRRSSRTGPSRLVSRSKAR
jgi:hypothetical protein